MVGIMSMFIIIIINYYIMRNICDTFIIILLLIINNANHGILQWTGAAIPASCDGFSLLPFLVRGKRPGLLLFALRLPRAYLGKWSYFMEKSQ